MSQFMEKNYEFGQLKRVGNMYYWGRLLRQKSPRNDKLKLEAV
jgi:hypothetical protein